MGKWSDADATADTDAAVAEIVFGRACVKEPCPVEGCTPHVKYTDGKIYELSAYAPCYSSSIEYAWYVVNRLRSDGALICLSLSPKTVGISIQYRDQYVSEGRGGENLDDFMPLAICRAALNVLDTE